MEGALNRRSEEPGRDHRVTEEEAVESVDALVGDVRYIMSTRPHTNWPMMATAALEHHDPPIPERLLPQTDRRRQRAAFDILRGLRDSRAERIRTGILALKAAEEEPGLRSG